MMEFLRELSARHERLKKKIHSTRIPLSANGQRVMGVVYFSIPVICGYYIMKWAERKAETNFQLEEDKIRHAGGASTKYVQQQNAALKKMLEEKSK